MNKTCHWKKSDPFCHSDRPNKNETLQFKGDENITWLDYCLMVIIHTRGVKREERCISPATQHLVQRISWKYVARNWYFFGCVKHWLLYNFLFKFVSLNIRKQIMLLKIVSKFTRLTISFDCVVRITTVSSPLNGCLNNSDLLFNEKQKATRNTYDCCILDLL